MEEAKDRRNRVRRHPAGGQFCVFRKERQKVVGPIGRVFFAPDNVHFPWRDPQGVDTEFAAKWAHQNNSMYHSTVGARGALNELAAEHRLRR